MTLSFLGVTWCCDSYVWYHIVPLHHVQNKKKIERLEKNQSRET